MPARKLLYRVLLVALGVAMAAALYWCASREMQPAANVTLHGKACDVTPPPAAPADIITDRREVGRIIGAALNSYYQRHGEYPPYLYGVDRAADPLISDHRLKAYPLSWPQPEGPCRLCSANPWLQDERGYHRWVCAVSTPGQPYVELSSAARDTGLSPPDDLSQRWEIAGGYASEKAGVTSVAYGRCWADAPLNCFGYQRGEWLARSEHEAWLWLYGSNLWPAAHPNPDQAGVQTGADYELFIKFRHHAPRGLDLLDAASGELIPDGIPDGICLLYHFKHGALASIVDAEYQDEKGSQASSARPGQPPVPVSEITPASIRLTPAETWDFGQPVELRVKALAQPGQQLAVYIGAQARPAMWLNDLGWPPDGAPGDGEFTGTIEWGRMEDSGTGLPLRLALLEAGEAALTVAAGRLDIAAPPVELTGFKYYDVQNWEGQALVSRLQVDAQLSPALVPGRLFACVPKLGVELELHDDGIETDAKRGDGSWAGRYPEAGLPPAHELELQLELRETSRTTSFGFDPQARPAAPVQIKRLWREPSGPLRIGTPVKFHAELTGELADVYIMITCPLPAKSGVNPPAAQIAQLTTDGRPGTVGDPPGQVLTGDWDWQSRQFQPGSYNLTATLVNRAQDHLQQLKLDPVELLAP